MVMQACGYLVMLGPSSSSLDGGGSGSGSRFYSSGCPWSRPTPASRRRLTVNSHGNNNHYAILGVSPKASSSDIKKAYRLLALKYHPDVNKEVGANEAFKSIRRAYDILINETTRMEYDQSLCHQESRGRAFADEWVATATATNPEYDDGLRFYRWAYTSRRMRRKRYWEEYNSAEEKYSEEKSDEEKRGSFIEVLKSAFLSLFLMQTVGIRLSLTFSSLMALTDRKLDGGYKLGYLLAWILGGRGGILLTMFLTFAVWVCGKTNSNVVAVVVVAMWFGSNLARFAPIPQGALLTLLYMSIKLQLDLN